MNSEYKLPKPKVSNRMKIFVDRGLDHMPYWDFCCDHGYIGIYALKSERFSEVHFVDQVPHIMERLKALFRQSKNPKYDFKYFFHTSSGEDLQYVVNGNCLIAGVGGTTIKIILESLLKSDRLEAKRLLLSPHLDEHILIPFMESLSELYLFNEKIEIQEGRRVRPLYIYDRI